MHQTLADLARELPGWGCHTVYMLRAAIPGKDPVEQEAALVYVGVTSNPRARLLAHARTWWGPSIVPDACEFERFDTRAEADAAETRAIITERPALNLARARWAALL